MNSVPAKLRCYLRQSSCTQPVTAGVSTTYLQLLLVSNKLEFTLGVRALVDAGLGNLLCGLRPVTCGGGGPALGIVELKLLLLQGEQLWTAQKQAP